MERRGIRELKVNASAVIALVKRGEIVEITERGVPVARLVPLPADDRRTQLERDIEAGLVTPATGSFADLLATMPLDVGDPEQGAPTLTEILLRQRYDDER